MVLARRAGIHAATEATASTTAPIAAPSSGDLASGQFSAGRRHEEADGGGDEGQEEAGVGR